MIYRLSMLHQTLHRAAFSKRQLKERMVEFWTDHFNILYDKVQTLKVIDDRDVIRAHALGKFPDMLRASAESAAMLLYLDQNSSRKPTPNQNYAREIMELHTVGVDGGYTQDDVAQLSRILTGWSYNNQFVDQNDHYRHSKWLSFMDKRLRVAKRLLRPDGVLIVTIDEHELHHLGMLIEQIFRGYRRYVVSIVINSRGSTGDQNFGVIEEQALFVVPDDGNQHIHSRENTVVGFGSAALNDDRVIEMINDRFVPVWVNVRTTPVPPFPFLEHVLVTGRVDADRRVIDRFSRTFFFRSVISSSDGQVLLNGGPDTVAKIAKSIVFEGESSYEANTPEDYLTMMLRALERDEHRIATR